MTRTLRSSASILFASLAGLVAVVGCNARTTDASATEESPVATAPNPCAGKACGVDCSPPGSDEPFSCNSAGQCVATGQPLGCGGSTTESACLGKACGVDCSAPGSDEPFSCNSAGQCVATGQPLGCSVCPPFVGDCAKGSKPADLDGDGCIDGCKEEHCPPFVGDCQAGDAPADTNGDGCVDACKPAPSPACNGKACGVDCTPDGSDEPFSCNSHGACIATGQPLGCK